MPLVQVKRTGVRPSVRKVPTSTTAVAMPMTLERVGKELAAENEDPAEVESLADAFQKFQPNLNFKGRVGEEETEFKAEFKFRNIKDFDPASLQTKQEVRDADGNVTYMRNDIADLKSSIDLMYRIKDRWRLPAVRRAWGSETQRKEIIDALGRLRDELSKIAEGGK